MSDGKRRRSTSPPPQRSGKGCYDSLGDGRGGRGPRQDRDRDYDRDYDRDRDRERERDRVREREQDHGTRGGDREYDRAGGSCGRRTAPAAAGKGEPSYDGAMSYRGNERDRDRDRERDREQDGKRVRRGSGRDRDVREGGDGGRRRRRDDDEDGGGGQDYGGGEASRFMSGEEREERQRQEEEEEEAKPKAPKAQPNLGLSGKLAAEANRAVCGRELKHVPPPESKLPDKRWRLYIFKNDQLQDEPYRIHRRTHYLFGRDLGVADIVAAHPSCSKQHAVLQFRLTEKNDEYDRPIKAVRPYLLDLGSVNGTFLNGERLEPLRYYELFEKDVVRLGQSTREYVLLHDLSGGDD